MDGVGYPADIVRINARRRKKTNVIPLLTPGSAYQCKRETEVGRPGCSHYRMNKVTYMQGESTLGETHMVLYTNSTWKEKTLRINNGLFSAFLKYHHAERRGEFRASSWVSREIIYFLCCQLENSLFPFLKTQTRVFW